MKPLLSHRLRSVSVLGITLLLTAWPAVVLAHAAALDRELPSNAEYLRLGVEHILTGFDHLLFLTALIVVGSRVRDLLLAISAFTLAHSITLAASVLDIVSVNPAWIEVLIALSLTYVGLENLFRKPAIGTRARLTFAFGLIHGFGFAGALREIGLPPDRTLSALLCFNLGVELGQLAVLAPLLPLILGLRRFVAMRNLVVPALSGAVALAGATWALTRSLAASSAEASTPTTAAASSTDALTAQSDPGSEAAQSTYPQKVGPLQPWTEALCEAFQRLPRKRSAECSGRKPGIDFTDECLRMLNAAVTSGALHLDPELAPRCIAATTARYASCDAVAGSAAPPECSGLITGTRADGASCRSSLECSDGLHCQGVSPVNAGVCRPPSAQGRRCGQHVDPLLSYLPLPGSRHPECAGRCTQNRCAL